MLRPRSRLAALQFGLIGVSLWAFGCTGTIAGGDRPGTGGPGTPGPGTTPVTPGTGPNPGTGPGTNPGSPINPTTPPTGPGTTTPPPPNAVPGNKLPSDATSLPGTAPLRRLTILEYQNTVRDLLGVAVPAARVATLSDDQESGGSGFVTGGAITAPPDVRTFMLGAEEISALVLPKVAMLLPCSPLPTAAAEQDVCADKFVANFGRRAYRRPLTDAEVAELKALYRAQKGTEIGATFPQAIANVISATLQSPWFLYRWELGTAAPLRDGRLIKYNQHEIASRLSYLFWSSMPDDKLFAAADGNLLSTPDQIANEARRLLNDPKARDALNDFHLQWLGIGDLKDLPKDSSLADYSPAVADSMLKETREFVASVFQGAKADGKLETLLTSPASFVDGTLAKIYGLPNVTGTQLQPVMLNPAQRAGLLTQGTFLTAKADAIDSHPIKRGDTLLGKVLCIHLEIPADVDVPPLPEPKPGQTTRERVSIHSMAACASCHKLIDPVGFSFENYDAIGKYRTTEEGKNVDASGTFSLSGGPISFKNAVEMLPQVARSQEARDCQVKMWARYANRRQEVDGEEPSLAVMREALKQSNQDLRELLVSFTRTRSFSHRMPAADEVLQ